MGYLDTQLNKAQTGFVRGRGCHVNITRLLEKVKNAKKREKQKSRSVIHRLFKCFQYSQQRTTIPILKEKSILTTWGTEWLQGLHERLD